jgi:hypothetical protein
MKINEKKIISYIKVFFEKLSSKPRIDSIEIEDTFIKYAYFEKFEPKTFLVKLPPGIVKEGKLVDKKGFVELLINLKKNILGEHEKKNLKVNVLLPRPLIFTELINVPLVPEEELQSTIELNLKMISPFKEEEGNKSAQILSSDGLNYEILAAFVSKNDVLAYQESLMEAGFTPVSFEFGALGLARFLRKYFNFTSEIGMVLEISSAGIDISVLREKKLVFNYFKAWNSFFEGVITEEAFKEIIINETKKVFNFVYNKFNTSLKKIYFIAPFMQDKIAQIIYENFGFHPEPVLVKGLENKGGFYAVIGGALSWEENYADSNYEFINLGGKELIKLMYEDQMLNFALVWRGILGATFGFLLLVYLWGNIFEAKQYEAIKKGVSNFKVTLDEEKLRDLENKAKTFNAFVSEIEKGGGSKKDFYTPFKDFLNLLKKNNIKLKSINSTSFNEPFNIIAQAPNYNAVFKFKDELINEGQLKEVNIPLTQIVNNEDGSVNFLLTFKF